MKKRRVLSFLAIALCSFFSYNLKAQNVQSFLNPPEIIYNPSHIYKYSEHSRQFTGISSMAVSPNGRMWATWYAGPTPDEDVNNYVILATSNDEGNTWEEILVIDPDGKGPVRAFDPEIWIDPDNTLWLFWAQTIDHDGSIAGVWAMKTSDLESKNPTWSKPERLTDGIMMNKPTVLSNGDWVLPVSTWRLTNESAKVVVSTNKGKTWSVRGACNIPKAQRSFDEHMIVERNDGSLWMLVRTRNGIGESFSKDHGRTWSALKQSDIQHTSSRFFIRRLNSGNLLLVKHGPIKTKTERSHLMAFISKDDGKTWSKGLLLDERLGVSYPDGQQMKDGTIAVTYDYDRKKEQFILMTTFKEEDIFNEDYDQTIIDVFNRRKVISKGGFNTISKRK